MNAAELVQGLNGEGARRNSTVRGLLEDGSVCDIMIVEADDLDGTIYLKLEVSL